MTTLILLIFYIIVGIKIKIGGLFIMDTNILNLLNPELAVVIPFLAVLGKIIKDIVKGVDNGYIPLILGIVSILVCGLYFKANTPEVDTLKWIFNSIVQGVLNAAVAVYGHQMFKNLAGINQEAA
jgi:hypothetical protein